MKFEDHSFHKICQEFQKGVADDQPTTYNLKTMINKSKPNIFISIQEHPSIYHCFINLVSIFNSMTNGVQYMQLPGSTIKCVQPPVLLEHGWDKHLQNIAKFKVTLNITILTNTNKFHRKHQ